MMKWQSKLIELGLAFLILFGAYMWVGNHAVEQYKQELVVEQAKVNDAQQKKYNLVVGELEELKLKRQDNAKVLYKQVEKVITRDVYRNVCLDDDGLRLINEAISGGRTSEPTTTVSPNTTY